MMHRREQFVIRGGLCTAGTFALVAIGGMTACGKADRAPSDSVVADTAHAAAVHDSIAAPRVVPYDPSAPGAMRSGAAPIRAAPTPVPVPSLPAASRTSDDSVGDPAAIVRDYYAAIRVHDFLRAYRMWEASGQRGARSYAQFEAGFDSTETVEAKVGSAGQMEGAAGSRFVTVPLEIDARLRNGAPQRFVGTYTLRRVIVPGASAAQRRWHLYSANIRVAPGPSHGGTP